MAQTVIIAAGQTATTADVTVTTGNSVTLAMRSTTAGQPIPRNIVIGISLMVNGVARGKASLMSTNDTEVIAAPGVWRVSRDDISAYGVNIEVTADV